MFNHTVVKVIMRQLGLTAVIQDKLQDHKGVLYGLSQYINEKNVLETLTSI